LTGTSGKKNQDHKLDFENFKLSSDQEFGTDEYDHDAFLGEDIAEQFEDLTQEEAKIRLGHLFHKMDKNQDGKLSKLELSEWIRYVTSKFVRDSAIKEMVRIDKNFDGLVSWEEYKSQMDKDMLTDSFELSIKDYERRFHRADIDNNKELDHEEFAAFLHPEEYVHMRELLSLEIFEKLDKDGDGKITEHEYLRDMMQEARDQEVSEDSDDEDSDNDNDENTKKEKKHFLGPEWVKQEADNFRNNLDTNRDKYLDKQEVHAWISTDDDDHVEAEIDHLLKEADDDKDGELSKDEVVERHMDVFAGSSVTDFGDAIVHHDEF